ncbi:MAG: isocitrate lyase/phosphoenolpyruvate mutase family protein [Planctomycetes bacterium]|nr:isocitrate lyase/phosphoenolpyruvate mutase family protein [Planctomycetota bacterium]
MNDKAGRFRELLAGERPVLLAGAHDGLSAKLAEEARFDAIWASGFEISASHALPDANLLGMTENLAAAKEMNDAVAIPVIADCDNGYGNAINVIRTVREYEKAGIAGISIEDNVFPKRCSFYVGVERELVSREEHAGKIRAAVEARVSKDFAVIARTEALIAGWGMEEALARARAYASAGADLLLIHSKSDRPDEVLDFARRWDLATPLVCVPTTYGKTSAGVLYEGGYRVVIFANQGLRAAVRAMQETFAMLAREARPAAVEDRIAPLPEIYRLVGEPGMKRDEKKYLAAGGEKVTAVILAAGDPKELAQVAGGRPKSMLDVKGKTILERQVETLNACGIKTIAVVRGYRAEAIDLPNLHYYENEEFAASGEVASLFRASPELAGRVLVLYGDILFDRSVVEKLMKSPRDVTLAVDRAWRDAPRAPSGANRPDLVIEDEVPATHHRYLPAEMPRAVRAIGTKIDPERATAEWIGMTMFSDRGCRVIREVYDSLRAPGPDRPLHEAPSLVRAGLTDFFQELLARGHEVWAIEIYKGWMEIDTFEDYQRAWASVR